MKLAFCTSVSLSTNKVWTVFASTCGPFWSWRTLVLFSAMFWSLTEEWLSFTSFSLLIEVGTESWATALLPLSLVFCSFNLVAFVWEEASVLLLISDEEVVLVLSADSWEAGTSLIFEVILLDSSLSLGVPSAAWAVAPPPHIKNAPSKTEVTPVVSVRIPNRWLT